MSTEFTNPAPQTIARDPLVLSAPQTPVLPLHAAHPTQHDGNPLTVGALEQAVVSNFQLPANEVQSQIFDVQDIGRIALRVAPEEQIGGIGGAANEIIAAVDLQVEASAATADLRKAVVRIATLRN